MVSAIITIPITTIVTSLGESLPIDKNLKSYITITGTTINLLVVVNTIIDCIKEYKKVIL